MHSLLRHVLLLAFAFTVANTVEATTTKATGPTISSQPKPQTVTAGSSATFSVTAKGTGTLKYQWQFKNGNISGATKSSYTISKVSSANAGTYSVVVSQTVNKVTTSATSNGAVLAVKSSFAGKYNMAVIEYNATDVTNGLQVNNGSSSGGALYGTSTVTGTGPFTLASTLKGYLGDDVTGTTQTTSGTVSTTGKVTIKSTGNNLTINIVQLNGTPIGFVGTGTPKGDNSNDGFILGLNATTTAPKSAAACAGNYTVIIISYNATAVSKKNAAQDDGDASIGNVTVSTNGAFTVTQYRYADGGGDQLGKSEVITGQVSSSGTVSSVLVQTGSGPITHPISLKFVSLNGQVIGFTGTFSPIAGADNSGILIGIRGLFTPLGPSFF